MSPLSLLTAIFGAMSVAMLIGWAYQRARANGGWTDVFWSYSVGLVGAAAALAPVGQMAAPSVRQMLVAALVGLWRQQWRDGLGQANDLAGGQH